MESIGHKKILTETKRYPLYNKEIKTTIIFEADELYRDIEIIRRLYETISDHCEKFNCVNTAYELITARLRGFERSCDKLKILIYNRQRRGLINAIGSVSETLFGT